MPTARPQVSGAGPGACQLHHAVAVRTLEGMQPTLRQVPPRDPLPSTQVTFRPSCAALIAAT